MGGVPPGIGLGGLTAPSPQPTPSPTLGGPHSCLGPEAPLPVSLASVRRFGKGGQLGPLSRAPPWLAPCLTASSHLRDEEELGPTWANRPGWALTDTGPEGTRGLPCVWPALPPGGLGDSTVACWALLAPCSSAPVGARECLLFADPGWTGYLASDTLSGVCGAQGNGWRWEAWKRAWGPLWAALPTSSYPGR